MRDCDALITGDVTTWEVAIYLGERCSCTISQCLRADVVSVIGPVEALPDAHRIAASLEAEVFARQQQRMIAAFQLDGKAAA
jgi:hypothetical protein